MQLDLIYNQYDIWVKGILTFIDLKDLCILEIANPNLFLTIAENSINKQTVLSNVLELDDTRKLLWLQKRLFSSEHLMIARNNLLVNMNDHYDKYKYICDNIKKLSICYTNSFDLNQLNHFSNLRELKISNIVSSNKLSKISDGCLLNLESLYLANINNCSFISDFIVFVSNNCKNLISFELSRIILLSPYSITSLLGNRKLVKLGLNNCIQLRSNYLSNDLKFIIEPNNIKILRLWSNAINNFGLITISRYCLLLETIELHGCKYINDEGIYELTSKCCNLSTINIARTKLSDESLSFIGLFSKQLTHINICQCEEVTFIGIEYLFPLCNLLQSIDISSCLINDFSLQLISLHCPNITYLNVSSCNQITDDGINYITINCIHLRYINMFSSNLTDKSLEYLSNYSNKLVRINLSCVISITINGLNLILQQCLKLREVNIRYCNNINQIDIQRAVNTYKLINFITNIYDNLNKVICDDYSLIYHSNQNNIIR